jgi:hypothetical protein
MLTLVRHIKRNITLIAATMMLHKLKPPSRGFNVASIAHLADRRSYTTSNTVPLAFDLHKPAQSRDGDEKQTPIIFMHGLFGSKKNNRTISR